MDSRRVVKSRGQDQGAHGRRCTGHGNTRSIRNDRRSPEAIRISVSEIRLALRPLLRCGVRFTTFAVPQDAARHACDSGETCLITSGPFVNVGM